MNSVILIGNLARDPETRATDDGMLVCRFTVAVNNHKKDKEADFIQCVAFGKLADNINSYQKKGMKIGVKGRISVGSYEKDGEKRYKTEVVADNVEFLSKKKDENESVSF